MTTLPALATARDATRRDAPPQLCRCWCWCCVHYASIYACSPEANGHSARRARARALNARAPEMELFTAAAGEDMTLSSCYRLSLGPAGVVACVPCKQAPPGHGPSLGPPADDVIGVLRGGDRRGQLTTPPSRLGQGRAGQGRADAGTPQLSVLLFQDCLTS